MARGKGKKKAMTNAQKQANYRQKKKELNSEKFLENHKEVVKKYRNSMSKEKTFEAKRKNREQKRKKYEEKKSADRIKRLDKEKERLLYKTEAALGKARSKVAKALPEDPLRAKEVVDSLSRILMKRTGEKEELVTVSPVSEEGTVKETIKLAVKKFYYQKDVSYEFPGMKDYVRVKLPGEKAKKMVKHVLLLSLKEAYTEFKKDNPDKDLHYSTFALLRCVHLHRHLQLHLHLHLNLHLHLHQHLNLNPHLHLHPHLLLAPATVHQAAKRPPAPQDARERLYQGGLN